MEKWLGLGLMWYISLMMIGFGVQGKTIKFKKEIYKKENLWLYVRDMVKSIEDRMFDIMIEIFVKE